MSALSYQNAMARLVTDPGFRQQALLGQWSGLPLTAREKRRLQGLAVSPGLEMTRRMYKGFRLGRLYHALPGTCEALGDDLLAAEVEQYWAVHPPTSFYYAHEGLAFARFLRARMRRGVLNHPMALLELAREETLLSNLAGVR